MGIPRIEQLGPGWCGHATLAMVLRFWGYNLQQEDIYAHLKSSKPLFGLKAYITIGELALAAMQLTKLKVTLATPVLYKKLEKQQPGFTPYVLLKDSLTRGYPCIMLHIDHFYVVFGFGEINERYFLKDSRYMGCKVVKHDKFDHMWSRDTYPYNTSIGTSYSLLIIRPLI